MLYNIILCILDCRTFESALKNGSAAQSVSVFTERTDPSSAEQYFQVFCLFSICCYNKLFSLLDSSTMRTCYLTCL